jgi:hypothetical protein
MDTGFSPSVIACFTAISILPLQLRRRAVVTYNSHMVWDFHVGLTLGVFTRCYSHHHGYFLFLHLIMCLNSVGDRDGEMGWRLLLCLKWNWSLPFALWFVNQETTCKLLFSFLKWSFFSRPKRRNPLLLTLSSLLSPSLPHTLQAFTFDGVGSNNTSLHSNTTTDVSL